MSTNRLGDGVACGSRKLDLRAVVYTTRFSEPAHPAQSGVEASDDGKLQRRKRCGLSKNKSAGGPSEKRSPDESGVGPVSYRDSTRHACSAQAARRSYR